MSVQLLKLITSQTNSVQSLDRLGRRGDIRDDSADTLSQSFFFFLQEASHCEMFWHGQGCPLSDVAHPAFSPPTTASLTFQSALKDDLWRGCCGLCEKEQDSRTNNQISDRKKKIGGRGVLGGRGGTLSRSARGNGCDRPSGWRGSDSGDYK